MRFLTVLSLAVAFAVLALATKPSQYAPKAGESVLRIAVEGRGDIFVLVHTKKAPKTAEHILKLARGGFYDGQRFHKVVRSPRPYLAQLGDPQSKTKPLDDKAIGTGGTGARIPYEATGFVHEAGAVGLAHPDDGKKEGDSQFYMLLDQARFLDDNYTVFGKVVGGMDVLKKIERGDRVVSVTVVEG